MPRLVSTNEESDDGTATTVTFEKEGRQDLLVMWELYRRRRRSTSIEGMDEAMAETIEQLDEFPRHSRRTRGTDLNSSISLAVVGVDVIPSRPFSCQTGL